MRKQTGINNPNYIWSDEDIFLVAKKCSNSTEFRNKFKGAYCAAYRRGLYGHIRLLFTPKYKKWNNIEDIKKEAIKYDRRVDFENGNPAAYSAATRKGVMDIVCAHMSPRSKKGKNNPNFKWSTLEIEKLALSCISRNEFRKKYPSAYWAACNRGIMNEICKHMPIKTVSSSGELELLKEIQHSFPNANKYTARNIIVKRRPYINRFDLDIFIPELKKGIEFDGTYHHSIKGLIRGRKKWPLNALKHYHEIKDKYFASVGIEVLHIKEEDWVKNKKECIKRCLKFLNSS